MQHAQRIEYLQFREELLRIAADESKHADWLAEKMTQSGGSLPPVLQTFPTKRNSWQYLLDHLEEEQKCSGDLETAMLTIESDYPEVVELLQRIDESERNHRDVIRGMLMRSDPQALWPA